MKATSHASWCLLFALLVLPASGQQSVRFDQARYEITPGQTFQVQVLIDPVPASGLASYGIRLIFEPTNAAVAGLSAITPPSALDFNGVRGPGAVKAVGLGFAAVKGTVDFFASPAQFHSGEILATVSITDQGAGSYTLNLDIFNTLGLTEQVFVDGVGGVLDPHLTFGSALVNYRPTVRIVRPTNNAGFMWAEPISILAEATDPYGAVAKVEFFAGTNRLGEATTAPFTILWANAPVGDHTLTALATDDLGATNLSNPVLIHVRSNSPPVLAPIGPRQLDELTRLTIAASATDPEAPPQTLTFSLDPGAPEGSAIDRDSGVLQWVPSEAQGPGVYPVTVRVTDNGVPPLTAAETISITVNEVNAPPSLAPLADRTVFEGGLVTFTVVASDPDLPPQHLTFSLDAGAPGDASIDSATGEFAWTPALGTAPSTNLITVRVTDDGAPLLSDSRSFRVFVQKPAGSEPYAIFAGEYGRSVKLRVLNMNGQGHVVVGRVHSNSGIDVSGNDHVFRDGDIEYVTGIRPAPDFGGKATLQNSRLVVSIAKPYPVDYTLAEFAPGGASAVLAQAAGHYFHVRGDTHLDDWITDDVLREGLYFVEGRIHLTGALRGKVTLVATDEITLSATGSTLESYTRCLLAFSSKRTARYDKPAVNFSGSTMRWQGVVFAPDGGVDVTGSGNVVMVGSLIGLGVRIGGSGFQITGVDVNRCAPLVSPLTPTLVDNQLQITFPTINGLTYLVEYTDALSPADWRPLTTVVGNGQPKTIRPLVRSPQRYYRLRLE